MGVAEVSKNIIIESFTYRLIILNKSFLFNILSNIGQIILQSNIPI